MQKYYVLQYLKTDDHSDSQRTGPWREVGEKRVQSIEKQREDKETSDGTQQMIYIVGDKRNKCNHLFAQNVG